MGKSMTTSAMTNGQIDHTLRILRDQLEKHREELVSESVQIVLGQNDLGAAWYAEFLKRVEAISQTSVEEVDYDDPQWKTIETDRYAFVGDVTVADYPEKETGKKPVTFRELEFDYDPTDDEVLAKAAELNCRQPSRAECETYIRKRYTKERLAINPRIGLSGPAVERNGSLRRACIYGHEGGVMLLWCWAGRPWAQRCRFVVACK